MPGRKGIIETIILLLFLSVPVLAQKEGVEGSRLENARMAERGESIFQQKCSPCHSIGGGDRPTGPDLAGVTQRRDRDWIERFIVDPQGFIAEDPAARQMAENFPASMPDLGVSDDEVNALLAFLKFPQEEEHRAGEVMASAEEAPAAPGNPRRGEVLYIGTVPFSQGGAPCLACHGIAGHGLGGAASFGPDLTSAYESYGTEGMLSMLETMPFPSMEPVYAAHPLTSEESRDLTSFLAEVSGETPRAAGALARDSVIGGAAFFAVVLAFGWNRLRGVRRPLVEKSRKSGGLSP